MEKENIQWLKEPKIEGKAPNLKPVTPKMYGTPKLKNKRYLSVYMKMSKKKILF